MASLRGVHIIVSIHSPRRSEGRHDCGRRVAAPSKRFQSTPPAEARGDSPFLSATIPSLGFNPLPPPKRGETMKAVHQLLSRSWFQSTPPAEARGDGALLSST